MVVILDEILMDSRIVKEHFTLLEKVLVYLCQYTFYCRLEKCSFLHSSIMFLSFDIIPEDICISDLKV